MMDRSMTIAIGFLMLTAPLGASADRYLITFKNRSAFVAAKVATLANNKLGSAASTAPGQVALFAGVNADVEQSLEHLNMMVVDAITAEELALLEQNSDLAFVEKEVVYQAPRPINGFQLTTPWSFDLSSAAEGLGPKTPWGIVAVKAEAAWADSQAGRGARVLVLDTGIDRDHPALRNNFEAGRDFVGGGGTPYEYADSVGHGTHVAGTIAAELDGNGFTGVAPQAKILAGRVCSEQGCPSGAIVAGLNWAIQQKVDVVNMSLGGPFGSRSERQALDAAVAAGVVVVAASGNDGQRRVSYPAAFTNAIAVGAINNTLAKADFSNWGPELDVVAPGAGVISSVPMGSGREAKVAVGGRELVATAFVGSPEIPQAIENEMVFVGLGRTAEFQGKNVAGRFALISRGEIAFAEKAQNAIAAGATGVVIFNNAPGLIQGAVSQDGSTIAIPVVMIEQVAGQELVAQLNGGAAPRLSMETVKTDYASFDGTSMATPHVAGVVALMRAAKPGASPADVARVLKATAVPLSPNNENQFGAGLVDAARAVQMIKTIN